MADKKWSYTEITKSAENEIRKTMAIERVDLETRKKWAYGTYLAWYGLTFGWQEDGDSNRLEALTNLNAG